MTCAQPARVKTSLCAMWLHS